METFYKIKDIRGSKDLKCFSMMEVEVMQKLGRIYMVEYVGEELVMFIKKEIEA
jgi:hypothetical protein